MKISAILVGLAALALGPGALASVSEDEIQALREQVRVLSERLDALERQNLETTAPMAAAPEGVSPGAEAAPDQAMEAAVAAEVDERMQGLAWAERMRWSGDFRYRYEQVGQEGRDDVTRNRIRARALLEADVSDTMRVGLGLASGSDDPVSSNQTLGGGGSKKPINIDLAYFSWSGVENLQVLGGKFKNQMRRAGGYQLIWDSDWRPEGTAFRYDNGMLFASGLATLLDSTSDQSLREFSFGTQAGLKLAQWHGMQLTVGAGYYEFDSSGRGSFFGDSDFFGNSFDPATQTYVYDYHELEGFAELGFSLFGHPATLFADYVQNLDPDENNQGYAAGFIYGDLEARGDWRFSYTYAELEADAVFGLLTDSDFGGGGTDNRGSVFEGGYAFHENWNLELTYFLNETGISTGDAKDYDRLRLDLNFNYK